MQKIKKPSKKFIILSIASLLVLGLVVIALEKAQIINLYSSGASSVAEDELPENYINYDPPTEEEKDSGDKQKEKIAQNEDKRNNQDTSQNKTVTVIITDAGQYDDIIEVRSFIPDHYQDGTCTITFRKDAQVITKNTPAYKDVSTTICTNPLIKRSEFPSAGNWQVSVAYNAEGASGKSETQTINIK